MAIHPGNFVTSLQECEGHYEWGSNYILILSELLYTALTAPYSVPKTYSIISTIAELIINVCVVCLPIVSQLSAACIGLKRRQMFKLFFVSLFYLIV